MSQELTGKFSGRMHRTSDVESFRFALSGKMDFVPGQFMRVILDAQDKANKELSKYLSFSSAPDREYVEVTKRLSGSLFSQRLVNLKAGEEVLFQGPMGSCVLPTGCPKIGFVVGGIGITPVISILENIVLRKIGVDAVLLYSNRREDDIPFKAELDQWEASNRNIKIYHTVVDCVPRDPQIGFGFINNKFIESKMPDWEQRMIYVFGPPVMVDSMKKLCSDVGCDINKIRTESFVGY